MTQIAVTQKMSAEDGLNGLPTRDAKLVPLGYQQIALTTGAASALTVPAGAIVAEINVEAQALRYRDDGTNPTTSVGMLYPAGSTVTITLVDLTVIKLIATVAGAIANIAYYRPEVLQ